MTINEIQEELVDNFSLFDNWEDKYAYIIELGKKLPPLDEAQKTAANKIKGCQSNVWMSSSFDDGKVFFKAESDALIVKGLVSMLIQVLSGQDPKSISEAELPFIDQIGMKQHLSMTRANGLASMIKNMKLHALAYQSQQDEAAS